jgi:hypothetical protein
MINQKINLESKENNFNGIYNLTGKNIYVFSDGYQESEGCFITLILTNINHNNYKIELFIKKFLVDCCEPDKILYGKIIDNKIEINNDNTNKSHEFLFKNKILNYEYKVNNIINSYLEVGIYEGEKIEI